MYVNHPSNVWDIMEEDDIGTNDIDSHIPPMYRKNYRITSDSSNQEYSMNNYNQNDDDTLEVLRFRQRSRRTQQLFHNATWKEAWYARRWGSRRTSDKRQNPMYYAHDTTNTGSITPPPTITTSSMKSQPKQELKMKRRLEEKLASSSPSRHRTHTMAATNISPPFYTSTTPTHPTVNDPNDHLSTTSMSLLRHSQFISRMDDDAIAEAIVTYVRANRRRSIRRKFTNQHRKSFLLQKHDSIVAQSHGNRNGATNTSTATASIVTEPAIPSSLVQRTAQPIHHYHPIDDPTMIYPSEEERQRRRSEKAKKAYQTRLDNEKLRQQQRNAMNQRNSHDQALSKDRSPYLNHTGALVNSTLDTFSITPVAAYERIDRFLTSLPNDTTMISSSNNENRIAPVLWNNIHQLQLFQRDIELVLQPRKLFQRKELLLRILRDVFQARGMCIPVSNTNIPATSLSTGTDSMPSPTTKVEYKFMTKASVPELGCYILQRVRDRINELK
jgi:hypothetical protein